MFPLHEFICGWPPHYQHCLTYYWEVLRLHTNWQAGVCATCGAFRDRRGVERRTEGESKVHILQCTQTWSNRVEGWMQLKFWNEKLPTVSFDMSTPTASSKHSTAKTKPYRQCSLNYGRMNSCSEKHARFAVLCSFWILMSSNMSCSDWWFIQCLQNCWLGF